jgi:transposase
MSTASLTPQLFVGIDIAAATAAVAIIQPGQHSPRPFNIAQSRTGFAQLTSRLQQYGVPAQHTLVVMEASGAYWVQLAHYLHSAAYLVSVVNPKQAHDFASSLRLPGKSDFLDAQALAELGHKLSPPAWTPPPAVYHQLAQRIAERDDLQQLRTQLLNQMHALAHAAVQIAPVSRRRKQLLELLDSQIAAIDDELAAVVEMQPEWAQSVSLLRSIPGVGLLTAVVLVVTTLNFTTCNSAAALSRYAGLNPQPYESGTSVRRKEKLPRAGNKRLRSAAYMATLSAARYNPVIAAQYERLRAAGKAHKVARCAAARKLLHLAWAVVSKQRMFEHDYGQKAADLAPAT